MGKDTLSKDTRSKIMSSIRSKNTKIELILRKALWKDKIRYRLHRKSLPGNPDIVLPRQKIAIFVDGDFWHGYNWDNLKPKLKNVFWVNKISNNMKRDQRVRKKLRRLGWTVIRVWEHQLKNNPKNIITKIIKAVRYV
ncbi:MAG: very short patch repair endonuclease [Candidatus Aenigmarchaeota archaeon]|nr:very short patch repair endonuclease [Candidatus Aenigmarchaeota archaeon]